MAALAAFGVVPASAQGANAARDVYVQQCQSCHGVNGKATPRGRTDGTKDFDAPGIWTQPDSQWARAIAKGLKRMPPYEKSMTAQQIQDVVAYIRGIAKPKT